MRRVVAIFGQKQNGKSTLARMLMHYFAANGFTVARIGFADAVKDAAIAMFGMPRDVAYGGEAARAAWSFEGRTAREWLQWLGTDVGREQVSDDIWVKSLAARVIQRQATTDYVFVDDGRFPNELELLPRLLSGIPFTSIRIVRPGFHGDGHASEQAVAGISPAKFDYLVNNDKHLVALQATASEIGAHL